VRGADELAELGHTLNEMVRRRHEQRAYEQTQAAPVLANLRNLAIAEVRAATDALTGLPNTRAVQDTIKRMVAQASRTVSPLSAALLDLDHFKRINDAYGHGRGDEVLAAVPDDAADADTLVRAADRALYAAKGNGRNRVELFISPARLGSQPRGSGDPGGLLGTEEAVVDAVGEGLP
jgi:PleD family two-component response regulator